MANLISIDDLRKAKAAKVEAEGREPYDYMEAIKTIRRRKSRALAERRRDNRRVMHDYRLRTRDGSPATAGTFGTNPFTTSKPKPDGPAG